MGFGGSQDEDNAWWRFFKRLEKCVGSAGTEHMDFIYDVNLIPGLVWGVVDPFPEGSDIVNTGV